MDVLVVVVVDVDDVVVVVAIVPTLSHDLITTYSPSLCALKGLSAEIEP